MVCASRSRRRRLIRPCRPSRRGTVSVALSAIDISRHETLVVPVLRDEPDPGGQRGRHAAGPGTPPGDARPRRAAAARSPATSRPARSGRCPPRPARPTISPAPHVEGDLVVGVARATGPRRPARLARPRRPAYAHAALPRRPAASPVIAATSSARGRSATGAVSDVPGVAEHRDRVADLVDLLQVVADEQEGHALRLQVADAVEEPGDRGAVELRGRFVQDDEPGAERQRAGDLDELPLLDRQLAGRGAHVDVHRPGRQQLPRLAAHARAS